MASASTADTWRETGARRERRSNPRSPRPEAADGPRIARPPVPPRPAPRMRSTDIPPLPEHLIRAGRARAADDELSSTRPPVARAPMPPRPAPARAAAAVRPVERSIPVELDDALEDSRPVEYDRRADGRDSADGRRRRARPAEARAAGRGAPQPEQGKLRGWAAVTVVLLVTLAGTAADLYLGGGLGFISLVALTASSVLATLLVRRSDLVSTVIAPPLVFIVSGVAASTVLSTFNLAAVATLLIRGFPAMAIATGASLALALVRWAARR
ncbi:DUF6542 domain-containing protein [Geodermatophilus sp. CPCC 205506]|uniref:DUF6542 domain-containing protein n=1 Tax=Geodermatophilus sp. CPCC 205506 TaxID=2936596 RepID=UPI003EEA3ECC